MSKKKHKHESEPDGDLLVAWLTQAPRARRLEISMSDDDQELTAVAMVQGGRLTSGSGSGIEDALEELTVQLAAEAAELVDLYVYSEDENEDGD